MTDCADLPQWVTGDTKPDINARIPLLDQDGAVTGGYANLTGASVRFQMRREDDISFAVDEAATVVDPPNGQVRYSWSATDLVVPAVYDTQWEVTYADLSIQTTRVAQICVRQQ